MASLSMASTLPTSMSLSGVSSASPVFSSTSSVRVASTASLATPLRVSGASRNVYVVARASPQGIQNLEDAVQHAIEDAEELCKAEGSSGACAEAWDEVEELAAAAAHKKVFEKEKRDPLEAFCKEVPEADECRVYED